MRDLDVSIAGWGSSGRWPPRRQPTRDCRHSGKEGAAGNCKGGFGFHLLLCYLAQTGEPQMALEQLHGADLSCEILVRVDTCGQTKAFASDCRDAQGLLTGPVR